MFLDVIIILNLKGIMKMIITTRIITKIKRMKARKNKIISIDIEVIDDTNKIKKIED